MMEKFYIRRNRNFKSKVLTDYAQQYLEAQRELSRRYCVICSDKSTALVFENHKAQDQGYTVDLAAGSCSCKDFQDIQIPCRHAIAVICKFGYAIHDFIHEAYFITSYKATYEASFTPLNIESLSDDSDCEACNIKTRRGRIPKKRKHANRARPSKRANMCSNCKETGHTKRSPLCSGYKPEAFFYTRLGGGGIKIRESNKPATEPATEPATGPTTRAAAKRAIEAATVNEAWAVYKKRRQNNWAPTEKEKKKEEEYEQFLTEFVNKHGRLPRSADENPYMAEFGDFLPGFRKRICKLV